MLILLPPSETKRNGGDANRVLDLASLGFPGLTPSRRAVLAATRGLARNRAKMADALGLGATQLHEVDRNRALRTSPVMPALDRYTGVLYDALDAASLSPAARTAAAESVVIHSAMFGLLRADDAIPAYRLSHDSRLPELRLRAHWSGAIRHELERHDGLILDLRSEGYAALGPLPPERAAYFVRVVADGADGRKRALNHFNKKGKGEFVRQLLEAGRAPDSLDSLLRWADAAGVNLVAGKPGELELTVRQNAAGA